MKLDELLRQTLRPLSVAESDNNLTIVHRWEPIARLALRPDIGCDENRIARNHARYLVHAANVLPELVTALEALLAVTEEPGLDELDNRQGIARAALALAHEVKENP